jgi:ATP-dependent Lon protease
LDEVDKIGTDYRGDPASALLEVLDPEQNNTFVDHYIEVEFDLSDVMFVATANSLNIPPALLDRLEVIRLSGYTEDEKINIATRYLLPKQLKASGLVDKEIDFTNEALKEIVRVYTREAGVRSLEREISKVCRKVTRKVITDPKHSKITIGLDNLSDYLGVEKFTYGVAEKVDQVGEVMGLAWTEVGGELLTIEATAMTGKGQIIRTGSLGDVMKESVEAARSVVRARAKILGIANDVFEKMDIHVHAPEGATPKDGPSAGIAMTTAIVSALTKVPVRHDVAMTGEITLRGEVLQIGGLKEKLLAAHRGGIKRVLIPEQNSKDLVEIPSNIKDALEIIPVRWIDKVLELALSSVPTPLDDVVEVKSSGKKDSSRANVKH